MLPTSILGSFRDLTSQSRSLSLPGSAEVRMLMWVNDGETWRVLVWRDRDSILNPGLMDLCARHGSAITSGHDGFW